MIEASPSLQRTTQPGQRVAVIGAGFGGLAAAIRLRAAGHQVTLVEQRDQLGGRAGQLQALGYTFDKGPTIITAPHLLRDLWALAGRRLEDDLDLLPLTPYYRIDFVNGRHFDYGGPPAVVEAEIERFAPGEVEGYRRFLAATGRLYDRAFEQLGRRAFLSFADFLRVAPELVRSGAARSVAGYVGSFFRDPDLRTAFSFHPLFIGGNPFRASAIYSIVPYLEAQGGVWYARGGMHALVTALGELFRRLGGAIRLGDGVAEIVLQDGRVAGVRLQSGEIVPATAVVSNADPATTYGSLLARNSHVAARAQRLGRYRYSMSCFLLYLGLDCRLDGLAHHTILMPSNFRRTVGQIFAARGLPDELAAYVHAPVRTDPTMAPPGGESLYILAPVPNLKAPVDWEREGDAFRDRVIAFVEERLGLPNLQRHIVTEHRMTPLDFRDDLSSHLGAAFSIEPTLFQSASFRPGNRAADVPGLYFTGAGTHPGAGIPGVMLSAEITAGLVDRDVRQGRLPVARPS